MKKNKISLQLLTFFCVLLLGCGQNGAESPANCMNDVLISDVPLNRMDSNKVRIRDKIEHFAGLTKIDTGFNGIQIRIWYSYSTNIEHLIILTKKQTKWSGTLNKLKFKYAILSDTLGTINRVTKEVIPKSGWEIFTDSLISLGVLDLPDMSNIKQYPLGTDGRWFTVDFAECRKYRYYSYQDPWANEKDFIEARKAVSVSNLIEEELNLSAFQKNF